jgi:glycosyltransferase involved in cell wall biosynthesis
MRIVVDGGTWTNDRGYGRFTREILTAAAALPSAHRFSLVIDSSAPPELPLPFPAVRVTLGAPPGLAAAADGRRSVADLWRMSRALSAQPGDCVFFPSVYTFVPLLDRRPVVVCIHDAIAERFPAMIFATARARWFWTLKARAARWQAARIVTVSEHARQAIAEQYGVPAGDIRVVSEAPSAAFHAGAPTTAARDALMRLGLAPDVRFLLYVGGIAPHKNLVALVDAVAALQRSSRFTDVRLVIVGDYAGDVFYSSYPQVKARIDGAGTGGAVFAGRLDDEVVAGLMRLAQALVLPSLDEGFGLPAIEAAACGAAVLVTRHSAMPEVLGDAAAYFDPREEGALAASLEHLLADEALRARLGSLAAGRAKAWTWAAAGRRLLDVFDELAEPRAGGRG